MAGGLIAMPIAMLPGHSVPAATATASRPAVPSLSISVTDGKTAVEPGEQLTYLLSVKDTGTLGVPRLKVTQTLPAGLTFVSASGHGVDARGQVAWLTGIGAGGARTFTVVTKLTQIPARQLRLAAVACAEPEGSARPMVCAAHLDRLPAVAAEAAAQAADSSGGDLPAYVGGGVGVLVVAALLVLAGRRFGWGRRSGSPG